MKKVRIYPTDKRGKLLRGFCPTLCKSDDAERIAFELVSNLIRFGVKYGGIAIEDVA